MNLNEKWESFSQILNPETTNEQASEMRLAFMAGAQSAMQIMSAASAVSRDASTLAFIAMKNDIKAAVTPVVAEPLVTLQ